EACYLRSHSFLKDLKWMFRAAAAVASGRAWRSAQPPATLNTQVMPEVKLAEIPESSPENIEFQSFEAIRLAAIKHEPNANA
ncbi:MAG: hypothetical protein ABSG46_15965, partial [Candidatus Binataceae bacterium]